MRFTRAFLRGVTLLAKLRYRAVQEYVLSLDILGPGLVEGEPTLNPSSQNWVIARRPSSDGPWIVKAVRVLWSKAGNGSSRSLAGSNAARLKVAIAARILFSLRTRHWASLSTGTGVSPSTVRVQISNKTKPPTEHAKPYGRCCTNSLRSNAGVLGHLRSRDHRIHVSNERLRSGISNGLA